MGTAIFWIFIAIAAVAFRVVKAKRRRPITELQAPRRTARMPGLQIPPREIQSPDGLAATVRFNARTATSRFGLRTHEVRFTSAMPPATLRRRHPARQASDTPADPILHADIAITTDDRDAFAAYLTPSRRSAIILLFSSYPDATLTPTNLTVTVPMTGPDADTVVHHLFDIVRTLNPPVDVLPDESEPEPAAAGDEPPTEPAPVDEHEPESEPDPIEVAGSEPIAEPAPEPAPAPEADSLPSADTEVEAKVEVVTHETAPDAPDLDDFLLDVFADGALARQADERFASAYADSTVNWTAEVRRASPGRVNRRAVVRADLVLGNPSERGLYSGRVHADALFAEGTELARDSTVTFTATLSAISVYGRRVTLTDAELA